MLGCRWILQGLENLICWPRMSFKPTKSRTMVRKRGKLVDKFHFVVDGTTIPSITEKPVTSLRKTFDCSLRDTASIQATITKLGTWLSAVEKSGLPGRLKAWLNQRGILPRVLWPLLVYKVTVYSRDPGEKDQLLPPKMAGSAMQSYKHSTVRQVQQTPASLQQP